MSLESTVISFVPFDIGPESKPGLIPPSFFIPKSDMETPSLLKVGTATHHVYLDESRGKLAVKNPSDIVAKSIVEDYVSSQLGVDEDASPALFWVDRNLSVEEVLKDFKIDILKAKLHQKKWFLNVAMLADNDWNRYHQHNVISSFQRKVAEIIGWTHKEHEWMAPMTTMKSKACPFCGSAVPDGVAVCSACHNVVVSDARMKEIQASL